MTRHILVDTNVVLSALVFPNGVAGQAFWRIVSDDEVCLTQWIVDELHDVVGRKWPSRMGALDDLLSSLEFVLMPEATSDISIRDRKDQPILDAAVSGGADMIVTGDKAFFAVALDHPRVLTPREYLDASATSGRGNV